MKESQPSVASKLPSETSYNLNALSVCVRACVCVRLYGCVRVCACVYGHTRLENREQRDREREGLTFSESLPSLDRLEEKHHVWQLFLQTKKTKKTERKEAGKRQRTGGRVRGTVEARNKRYGVKGR